jgi:hypothetical protein
MLFAEQDSDSRVRFRIICHPSLNLEAFYWRGLIRLISLMTWYSDPFEPRLILAFTSVEITPESCPLASTAGTEPIPSDTFLLLAKSGDIFAKRSYTSVRLAGVDLPGIG